MKRLFWRTALSGLLILSLWLSLLPVTAFAARTEEQPETAAAVSVPSISSPFTTHPTVFIVEDTYQIAFATNATGLAWVEIDGVKYNDSENGLMNWKSKYHKVTVPQAALDAAGSYKICFRSLSERPSYDPVPGSTVSRTYPFDPIPQDRDPVFYCASDQHGDNSNALKISKYKSFDVYVFGGDYISTLMDDSGIKLLLDMTGAVTQGRKPTIYSRGNHEIRGSNCEDIQRVAGYSKETGPYYTVKMPGIFGIVLDAGEDKIDSHAEYGGTVQFASYRDKQTQWLREVVKSREWENYPVRMVFCHVPFGFNATGDFEDIYNEWTDLLDQMGVSMQISGHKHYYGAYGPNSTKYKTDPNFSTVLVTDRENGDYTYSATYITVTDKTYEIQNVLPDLSVKATKSLTLIQNVYVTDNDTETGKSGTEDLSEIAVTPATRASVPAISSPYTMHPTVFSVEDEYQIIFATEGTGMAWVEVGGTKYYDTQSGLMRYTTKYHSVRVPRVALDTARSYKVNYQSMTYREAYSPTHGSTVSRTYPFTPMADKKEPVILCLSDFRSLNAEAKAVAAYKSFDALYVGGDYGNNGNTENNVKLMLETASAVTNGTKPVIFTRGNREIRGNYSYLLNSVTPTSATGKSYYTIEQPDFFGIVLESGEDKLDSDAAYGATTDYQAHRKEQTEWLKQILAEGKWKDYPTRVAFCHIPMTRINVEGIAEEYAEWTEILNQMGISLLFSGHYYTHALYASGDTGNVSNPNFPVMISSDVDNADYKYSGSYVTLGRKTITIESVSAAKKLLKTTTTPNVTAPAYAGESYLMFDFIGDPDAKERYNSFTYGGVNFDTKSNWANETNTTAPAMTRGVLSFSPVDGTVTSVGVHSRAASSAKNQWAYRPLHYFTKATDYCQVRFKIENAVASNADGIAKFRLDVDCFNDLNDAADATKYYTRIEQSFHAADVVDKGYVTLTFPLNTAEYNKMEFMNLVHPQFVNLKSASGATAVFSIDYIYIGPQESFPKQDDYLFFDFTDTEADRERYNSFTYNYLNFDDPTNWNGYNGTPLSTVRDGALCIAVPLANTDTSHSVRSHRDSVKVLHYVPGEQDILQVRMQIKNAVATTTDGTATFYMYLDRSNSFAPTGGTARTYTGIPISFLLSDYVDQGWFTLEIPLTDEEYLKSDWITLVHPLFQDVKSATGKTAEFLIDYIYIGPEGKSPTANTVTFCAEDGTVLEVQKVSTGSSVSYTGIAPTKNYDEIAHYSFIGWVNEAGELADLSNIAESVTVYASFAAIAHDYEETMLATPSCSAEGVRELTCACGYSYQEAISPVGHTPEIIAAIAPTCTATGMSEGSYCSVCQAVIDAPVEVPALGHRPEVVPGYAPTCVNSGMSDGSRCSVCGITLTVQSVTPRLGHSYCYADNGDGTHSGTCERCDKTLAAAAHTMENGACTLCGCAVSEPALDESIKIYHTLDLASDISITFAIPQSALANYDSYYMEFILPEYKGNDLVGTSTLTVEPVEKGSYYYFTLTGITAVRMGDLVDATLHMTKGTQEYISNTDSYSVATYAYATLEKSTDAKMLTLCADLLRYGAEAQSYKKYRTDALVDAAMTDVHRSYLSNMESLTFTATDSFLGDLESPTITWVGKTLDLGSKVGLKFVFNTQNYSGNVKNLNMKVSYQGSNGETKTLTLTGAEAYGSSGSYYSFTFYGLLASELRTIVDVAIFDGETQFSEAIRYSAESYASKAMSGTLAPLCKALFAYSDSAKAYFAK